jgi:hypothetical protein
MPAGGRVCEPEEGPRVVLGALNPMGSVCPYLPCILAACCHAMAHTRLRPGLLCLGGQDQPGGSVLVRCDPRQHPPPSRLQIGRGGGEVGGYQVSVYQNPKPARGSINGALSGLCQSSHRCSDNDLDCGFQTAT